MKEKECKCKSYFPEHVSLEAHNMLAAEVLARNLGKCALDINWNTVRANIPKCIALLKREATEEERKRKLYGDAKYRELAYDSALFYWETGNSRYAYPKEYRLNMKHQFAWECLSQHYDYRLRFDGEKHEPCADIPIPVMNPIIVLSQSDGCGRYLQTDCDNSWPKSPDDRDGGLGNFACWYDVDVDKWLQFFSRFSHCNPFVYPTEDGAIDRASHSATAFFQMSAIANSIIKHKAA